MTEKEFEDGDPFELVGLVIPRSEAEHIRRMGETFIEEFLRMGWSDEDILELFRNPFYRGPYAAFRTLGGEEIRKMIRSIRAKLWRRS